MMVRVIESVADGWWYTAAIPGNRRVFASGGSWLAPPRITDASSSYSKRLFGNRWVAVGDAACQYDPLAAHGLMMAMTSARDAAAAILDGLGSAGERLVEYAYRMEDLFLHAERECRLLYEQAHHRLPADERSASQRCFVVAAWSLLFFFVGKK